jgi:hypothetical protein
MILTRSVVGSLYHTYPDLWDSGRTVYPAKCASDIQLEIDFQCLRLAEMDKGLTVVPHSEITSHPIHDADEFEVFSMGIENYFLQHFCKG